MSWDRTARSASFPGAIVPLLSSANSAYAADLVYAITACARVSDSCGLSGYWLAIMMFKYGFSSGPPASPSDARTTDIPETSSERKRLSLAKREGGTTLEEIMAAMNWQKHTTRAMLSAGGSLTKNHGLMGT